MPILPRQEQASAPSAGITFAATFGGVILLGLLVLLGFFAKRWRDRRKQQRARRSEIFFDAVPTSDDLDVASPVDRPHEKVLDLTHTRSHSDSSSQSSLIPAPGASESPRPSMPRLTIPDTPGFMKTAFLDHGSAVSSACMNSSDSVHSQWSVSDHPLPIFHPGPSALQPAAFHSHSSPSHAYNVATTDVTAAAVPLITQARPRRSLHPFAGGDLVTDASRMRMDSILELPSPFIFHPDAGGELPRRDSLPVSPTSPLSALEELDSFPLPPVSLPRVPRPESPAPTPRALPILPLDAPVPPLQIAKKKAGIRPS
ncbi:hypothetical protein FB451DRAFT_1300020 [Mycena latifolia]|nr:hypothetical protein FB451DRAFT_1300020 [Mycena latifolia]